MLEGCPDDGPAMRVDPKGRIHIVWPAVVTERGSQVKALFHTVSTDGQAFLPRTRIPTEGQANHPQLAVAANGSLALAWDESGSAPERLCTVEQSSTIADGPNLHARGWTACSACIPRSRHCRLVR
jgi:hypothetical protein